MTTYAFTVKQGDRLPDVEAVLRDRDGIVDLTTALSVAFHMSQRGGTKTVNGAGSVTDAAGGAVRYQWAAGDTDTPGVYLTEWEVTFPGPKTMTFPNDRDDLLLVRPQVA